MKTIILVVALILGFSTNVWAAVQTDTHTYIVSEKNSAVLAINRQTGQETRIRVGQYPLLMVIHGGMGYVVNEYSNNVSVLDLKTNTVTQKIPVGEYPQSMVIHGEMGYLVNGGSNNVSVLNLKTNTVTQTIPVGGNPRSIVIHEEMGYLVNHSSANVSVLNLKTNKVDQTIPVGRQPRSMVIHEGMGYVVNYGSNTVSVLDLQKNTVTQTIPVGIDPLSMVIHGDRGYVVNFNTDDVSVIDLQKNTVIHTIPAGQDPQPMVIQGDWGYVANYGSQSVFVIDLNTNTLAGTFVNLGNMTIDFSDSHVYLGLEKARPLYPTLASINFAKAEKTLGEFVNMMPEVFKLGEIDKRSFPKEEIVFDTVPPYALAQEIFWDLKTGKPLMDPQDIIATLITMKYPQKFLKTGAGVWLRNRLHMAFFQTVWMGDKDKAKSMLIYFVQLQDPVITNLATYTFKAPTQGSDQKATNSTDLN